MSLDSRPRHGGRLPPCHGWLLLVAALFSACAPEIAAETPNPPHHGSTIYVSASTGSTGGFGTITAPMRTITEALIVAQPGETVRVLPGTYDAAGGEVFPIVVPTGVSLIGDEANKGGGASPTIIRGAGIAPTTIYTSPLDPRVGSTVAGFTIQSSAPGPGPDMALILVQDAITVRNNTITGGNSQGLYVMNGSSHIIVGNVISGNIGAGLVFVGGGGAGLTRIESNIVTANSYGVEFDVLAGDLGGGPTGSVGGNQIYCNTINDFWTGIPAPAIITMTNNVWDHVPLSGNDFNVLLLPLVNATLVTTGATVVTTPCP